MSDWAKAAPNDVVATAAAELGGTSGSATYGAPYNDNATGQTLLGLPLQKWGGVRLPVDSAGLVLDPLRKSRAIAPAVDQALATWDGATANQRTTWATAYS